MIGTVKIVNPQCTRAGVFVEGYGFSVLEASELPASVGDKISGDLRSTGDEQLRNLTKGEDFEARIDDYDQGKKEITKSVLYPDRS
jgi:hypothetical protein